MSTSSTLSVPSASSAVARAAALLMAANLVSRALGLLRDTAIAAWFGQNAFTDAYRASFSIPDLLFFLLAGGVFSSAFVPVLSKYFADGKDDEAWEVFSICVTFLTLAIGALVVGGEFLARALAPLVAPGFEPWQLDLTAQLTRIVLPGQICFFLGGLFMAVFYVRGRFLIPAVAPIVYNLGIIAGGGIGVAAFGEQHGVAGLAWGALAGAVVGNFLLPVAFLGAAGARFRPSLNLRHPGVAKVGKLALPVLLGLSMPQVYVIINRMFASQLGAGVVSALENASREMQAPLGIFAQAISIAVFPALAALAARGQRVELQRVFSQGLRALWFISLPLSLLMMVLARDIVTVLLQYRRFTPADTQVTAEALTFLCLGLFAFSCQSLLNRAFYAVQDTLTPVIIGTLSTVVFVILNFALIGPLAHKGLALAGSLAAVIHMVWMLLALKRKTGIAVEGGARALVRISAAAVIAAGAGWLARQAATRYVFMSAGGLENPPSVDPRLASFGVIVLVLAIGGGVYLALAKLMGCEELQYAARLLARRRARAK